MSDFKFAIIGSIISKWILLLNLSSKIHLDIFTKYIWVSNYKVALKQMVVSQFELTNDLDSFLSRCTQKHDKNNMWEILIILYKAAHESPNQWIYSRYQLNRMKCSRIHCMVFLMIDFFLRFSVFVGQQLF